MDKSEGGRPVMVRETHFCEFYLQEPSGRRRGKVIICSILELSALLKNTFPQEKLFYRNLTYGDFI